MSTERERQRERERERGRERQIERQPYRKTEKNRHLHTAIEIGKSHGDVGHFLTQSLLE